MTAKLWYSTSNGTYNLLDLNGNLTCWSQDKDLQSKSANFRQFTEKSRNGTDVICMCVYNIY